MANNVSDVLIIGAGLIGCSTAYHLAKQGYSVTVVDRKEPCAGASGTNSGIIGLHTKPAGLKLNMAISSMNMYPEVADDLPVDCELELDRGCALLCSDEELFNEVSEACKREQGCGVEQIMLKGDDFRQIEPALSEAVYGVKYTPKGGMVNSLLLNWGLHDRAADLGAKFYLHTNVIGFIRSESRVMGVKTDKQGDLYANRVIDCTGCWSGLTNKMLGIDIPVEPRRGQTIITEAVAPMFRTCLADGNAQKLKWHPELVKSMSPKRLRLGHGFGCDQTRSGNLMISSTREFAGFDNRNTIEGVEMILHYAAQFLPAIKNMKYIHVYAGFRPFPKDGKPIVGAVKGLEGYSIASGLEGDGVALCPLIGWLMAKSVSGETHPYLEELSPDRLFV